ncbi:MAG TPA: helix-turn-helix domain-containing protein [Balneolaceae bacterium]|nr:helix-turn-helix domain-containing protein [Balneolaceae bacterium]
MKNSLNILRPSDLAEMLNVSRVTIWRMQKRGDLPPRKKISNRCVGWTEKTIENWLESRPFADPNEEEKRQSNLEPA